MMQKQIASCFLDNLCRNLIICAVTDLNAHTYISKWIFLAYALFWRTRSHFIKHSFQYFIEHKLSSNVLLAATIHVGKYVAIVAKLYSLGIQ